MRWQTGLFSRTQASLKAAKQLNQWRQKAVTLLDEGQLDALLDKLSGYAKPEERILILARYHHMRPASLEKAATRWPKLQIDFMTIHASKGQQADYVIIVGLQEGSDGFPAAARESIMEEALLPPVEDFPDAEERRLMYVALTGHAIGYGHCLTKRILSFCRNTEKSGCAGGEKTVRNRWRLPPVQYYFRRSAR